MAKQIQSLNSVLYHDLKVHEVARRNRYNLLWYWLHMKGYRSNLKDTFYEFFFMNEAVYQCTTGRWIH